MAYQAKLGTHSQLGQSPKIGSGLSASSAGVVSFTGSTSQQYMKLAQQTAPPGTTSLAFTSKMSSTYTSYVVTVDRFNCSTAFTNLMVSFSSDNGSTYLETNSQYRSVQENGGGSYSSGDAGRGILCGRGTDTCYITIQIPNTAASPKQSMLSHSIGYGAYTIFDQQRGDTSNFTGEINALKFYGYSGTIEGIFTLYAVL
ncbi:MAG: hypothetical protein K0S07_785 [Chlamydiales bacterium]|jgi:hypothetical protein|nr:hypothetical protein [Chlamydiales bacterium]